MTGQEARQLARNELQKRQPQLPERQKQIMAKEIVEITGYDPDAIVKYIAKGFTDVEPDKPKADSNT